MAGDGASTDAPQSKGSKRHRLSQEDVPAYSLEQALRVPIAIAENYAYKPTRPLNVAGALGMSPSAGPFRMLAGSAIAYGLTTAGAFAPEIGLTPLGLRIVRPTVEGDDLAAKREALLRPKVIGDFLRQYDGAALPGDSIARNVLLDRGVPPDRLDDVLAMILDGAGSVRFLKDINGKKYIDLAGGDRLPAEPSPREAESAAPGIAVATPVQSLQHAVVSPGVHINIEIHIDADASAETIEEIFRNMRRYVLTDDAGTE